MMKRRLLLVLSLVAVSLAACAPAEGTTPAKPPAANTQPPAMAVPTITVAPQTLEPTTEPASSEATALPVATSRGPRLEATNPTTVSLASGGLQFVEFFRFT
jgi:ABC-type transport system substrate-binding protein